LEATFIGTEINVIGTVWPGLTSDSTAEITAVFSLSLTGLTELFWAEFDPLGRPDWLAVDRAAWRKF